MTLDCRVKSEQSGSRSGLHIISAAAAAKFEKQSDDGDPVVQSSFGVSFEAGWNRHTFHSAVITGQIPLHKCRCRPRCLR